MKKKAYLTHLAKKLNAIGDLEEAITHEHNAILAVLRDVGMLARDIIELNKRVEKLEGKHDKRKTKRR